MDWSSFPIGNAAGFVKGPGSEFDDLLRSAVSHITVGSFTVDMRQGNLGGVLFLGEDGTSVNSLGLPNPGIAFQLMARQMADRAFEAGKNIRFSIAGFSPDDYGELASRLEEYTEGEPLEVNLGCPNVWGEGGQKPIASFDLELFDAILCKVGAKVAGPFDAKVSPYSDPRMIPRVGELLKRRLRPGSNVVVCNTFPNGLAYRNGKPALDVPGGYGGVGGNAMYHIALGQVAQFATALEGSGIGIWGVGGVDRGERLLGMRCAGATGVQVGTAFGERKGKVFSDIQQEALSLED